MSNVPGTVKQEADDLANDLVDIVRKHLPHLPSEVGRGIISYLCLYVTERDQRVLEHGRNLALKQLKKEGKNK